MISGTLSKGEQVGLHFSGLEWLLAGLGILVIIYLFFKIIFTPLDVSISFRNVLRNKRRSTITLLAVAVAFTGNVLLGSYFLDMFTGLRESTILSQTGHIQILKEGFQRYGSSAPSEYVIENYQEIIDTLQKDKKLKKLTNVYMKELRFNGIITSQNSTRSLNYLGRGVDAKQDRIISAYDTYIDGNALQGDQISQVILGEGLADQLMLEAGDSVTLLGTTYDGGLNVLDGDVRGVLRSFSKEYSNVVVKTNLSYAQEMLAQDGVNKIIILLNDTKDTKEAIDQVMIVVNSHPEWGVEVYDWYQLADFYSKVYGMFTNMFIIISSLLFALVIFLVINTMSMSIYERFSEFGTLRSIGLQKPHLISMVFIEGIVLGVLGVLLGVVLAIIVGNIITALDIQLPPPPGMSRGYPLLLRLSFSQRTYLELTFVSMSSIIAITAFSTIIPAYQVTKLKIVDALRHN